MPKPTLHAFVFVCSLIVTAALSSALRAQQATPPPPPAAGSPANPPRPETTAPSPNETPAVVAVGNSAQTLLGKPVQSAKGENLGRVVDVIVDRSGMVQAAIIDFGGFLGVGVRKIAVDWHVLHFPDGGGLDRLIADLPQEQLRKAPVYKEGEPIVIMGRTTPAPASPPTAPTISPGSPTQPPETEQPRPKP